MSEEQMLDFLITQSEILGLPKENCPYYQIMKYITQLKEKIYKLDVDCIKYEQKINKVLDYLDYIDDEILETCSNYDVNGIEIVKILKAGD